MKVEVKLSRGTKGIKQERGGQRRGRRETRQERGYLTNMQRDVNCDPRSFRCHKTGPRALDSRQGPPAPSLPPGHLELPDTLNTLPHTATSPLPASVPPGHLPCPLSLLRSMKPCTLFRSWLRCHHLWEATSCPTSQQRASLWVPQPESLSMRSMVVESVTILPAPGPPLKHERRKPFPPKRWTRHPSK